MKKELCVSVPGFYVSECVCKAMFSCQFVWLGFVGCLWPLTPWFCCLQVSEGDWTPVLVVAMAAAVLLIVPSLSRVLSWEASLICHTVTTRPSHLSPIASLMEIPHPLHLWPPNLSQRVSTHAAAHILIGTSSGTSVSVQWGGAMKQMTQKR